MGGSEKRCEDTSVPFPAEGEAIVPENTYVVQPLHIFRDTTNLRAVFSGEPDAWVLTLSRRKPVLMPAYLLSRAKTFRLKGCGRCHECFLPMTSKGNDGEWCQRCLLIRRYWWHGYPDGDKSPCRNKLTRAPRLTAQYADKLAAFCPVGGWEGPTDAIDAAIGLVPGTDGAMPLADALLSQRRGAIRRALEKRGIKFSYTIRVADWDKKAITVKLERM